VEDEAKTRDSNDRLKEPGHAQTVCESNVSGFKGAEARTERIDQQW
jgi:hypothetical protein